MHADCAPQWHSSFKDHTLAAGITWQQGAPGSTAIDQIDVGDVPLNINPVPTRYRAIIAGSSTILAGAGSGELARSIENHGGGLQHFKACHFFSGERA